MNLFLAILACIAALIAPYIILFIILSFCANKHNVTVKTLINKYSEVRSLFGIILGLQCIFLVAIALGIIVNAIIDRASFGPLTSILFAIAIMMGTFELCFGIPLLVEAGIDANYEIKNVLRKQSIKF